MIQFFVASKPMSTQTGTVINVNGRRMPLRRNPQFSKDCKAAAIKDRNEKGWIILEGPVSMGVTIYIQRPKTKQDSLYSMSGADVLNILKGPMDSMQGVVYSNDKQVVTFHRLEKLWTNDGNTEPGLDLDFRAA